MRYVIGKNNDKLILSDYYEDYSTNEGQNNGEIEYLIKLNFNNDILENWI